MDLWETTALAPAGDPTGERLTPEMVRHATFRPARRGRRGISEADIQDFCERVEDELAMLHRERAALQDEVGRLRRRLLGTVADADAAAFGEQDAHARAVRILAQAQQTAEQYVADAEEYSRRLAQDARERRDQILAAARSAGRAAEREAHDPARRQSQSAGAC